MLSVDQNVWILRYPLSLLGTQTGRTVTVLRLRSSEIIVHSTGPFSSEDVAAIQGLGPSITLVEASLFHDTFACQGRSSFPKARYLVPEGFRLQKAVTAESLDMAPAGWRDELEFRLLAGMPKVKEHVFYHKPSQTLIVADLVFNFGPESPWWTRFFFRHLAGIRRNPGMSRLFRMMIRDRAAFQKSLRHLFEWDFKRVIVGHGRLVEANARERMREALALYL